MGRRPLLPSTPLRALPQSLVLLFWLVLCADTLADCLKSSNSRLFGKQNSRCQTMHILPIRLMDTDTLFLSAAARRDRRMHAADKLLNNRWLLQSRDNTLSGSSAMRTALRRGVANIWQNRRQGDGNAKPAKQGPSPRQTSHNPLFTLSNYDLDISGNKMMLGFSYRF